jgi:5-methylcytosine-specific restriction endonuclease McrA
MKKIDREKVWLKYDKHCSYCGNEIDFKSMQVDHMVPKWMGEDYKLWKTIHGDDNLVPSCRRCNHYKRGDTLEQFRTKMMTLDERIEKNYINKVAIDFGIIKLKKFDGIFYFEKFGKTE